MLGCVRIATVRQMAQVITAEESDGRSYVRRAMVELEKLGLAETNGKDGKDQIWNLTVAGQKALADGNDLPPPCVSRSANSRSRALTPDARSVGCCGWRRGFHGGFAWWVGCAVLLFC